MRDELESKTLQAIGNLEALLDLRLVTPEFEVIATLQRHGALTSGELKRRVRLSGSGFNILLKRLIDMDIIFPERCADDQRRRKYRLSDRALEALHNSARLIKGPAWLD